MAFAKSLFTTQIQVQNPNTANVAVKYRGPWHCGTTLLKEGGVPSLYRGFGATFIRGRNFYGIIN